MEVLFEFWWIWCFRSIWNSFLVIFGGAVTKFHKNVQLISINKRRYKHDNIKWSCCGAMFIIAYVYCRHTIDCQTRRNSSMLWLFVDIFNMSDIPTALRNPHGVECGKHERTENANVIEYVFCFYFHCLHPSRLERKRVLLVSLFFNLK